LTSKREEKRIPLAKHDLFCERLVISIAAILLRPLSRSALPQPPRSASSKLACPSRQPVRSQPRYRAAPDPCGTRTPRVLPSTLAMVKAGHNLVAEANPPPRVAAAQGVPVRCSGRIRLCDA